MPEDLLGLAQKRGGGLMVFARANLFLQPPLQVCYLRIALCEDIVDRIGKGGERRISRPLELACNTAVSTKRDQILDNGV